MYLKFLSLSPLERKGFAPLRYNTNLLAKDAGGYGTKKITK